MENLTKKYKIMICAGIPMKQIDFILFNFTSELNVVRAKNF